MSEIVRTLTVKQLEVVRILDDDTILIRPPSLSAPQRWHIGLHLIAVQTIEKLEQKGLVVKGNNALVLTRLGKAVARGKAVQTKGRQWKIKTNKNLLREIDSSPKNSAKIERRTNATGL